MSEVHSATLPCMSNRYQALHLYEPTAAVNALVSFHFCTQVAADHASRRVISAMFSASSRLLSLSPVQNRVFVSARQAHSHSASVGNRYRTPSRLLSHSQNAVASFQLILTTG